MTIDMLSNTPTNYYTSLVWAPPTPPKLPFKQTKKIDRMIFQGKVKEMYKRNEKVSLMCR